MAYLTLNITNTGSMTCVHGVSKPPIGTNVAQIHMQHEYDFGPDIVFEVGCEIGGVPANYTTMMLDAMKTTAAAATSQQNAAITAMATIKSYIFIIKLKDRRTGELLHELRGRLHEGGGIEDLEEKFGNNPNLISQHMDYQAVLAGVFDRIETQIAVTNLYTTTTPTIDTTVTTMLKNFVTRYTLPATPFRLNMPLYAHPATNNTLDSHLWQQRLKEVSANYIGIIGADDIGQINALVKINQRTGGHLFIDLGQRQRIGDIVALSTTLNYDNHQVRLLFNPTKSRPQDGSSIRKSWRPCVGDYIAKHVIRNQLKDANGIPPIHMPIGGYNFAVQMPGIEYLDGFVLTDEDQQALAEAGVIMVINERFNRESRWIYGDILTQRDSSSSALRLANAAEIETFTARGIIEIAKRYLMSNTKDYIRHSMRDGSRFLDNCVAAGLLEPSDQLGGLYYALSIEPKKEHPFEGVSIKLARRPSGAVRQAFLETTINK